MDKLNSVLNRLKRQYSAYEKERINFDGEDGFIDMSVACSLADSVPYLIKTIEELQQENKHLERKIDSVYDMYNGYAE